MTTPSSRTALFLCTGNYYRSRTAEALFTHYASKAGLDWRADSRGLQLNDGNKGPISKFAVAFLDGAEVAYAPDRYPRDLTLADLEQAETVVAVDETEHRVLMHQRFPEWENRIEYWVVHDIDRTSPEDALPEIDRRIQAMIAHLAE